mmetsp:Transcript_82975/g.268460  ORF Transcript_82975/g.268460 Transcript_82975/m.268460 type:complete len:232 (-) Transcript_82975:986-1681(-)
MGPGSAQPPATRHCGLELRVAAAGRGQAARRKRSLVGRGVRRALGVGGRGHPGGTAACRCWRHRPGGVLRQVVGGQRGPCCCRQRRADQGQCRWQGVRHGAVQGEAQTGRRHRDPGDPGLQRLAQGLRPAPAHGPRGSRWIVARALGGGDPGTKFSGAGPRHRGCGNGRGHPRGSGRRLSPRGPGGTLRRRGLRDCWHRSRIRGTASSVACQAVPLLGSGAAGQRIARGGL